MEETGKSKASRLNKVLLERESGIRKKYGEFLKSMRVSRGLTQVELAEICGHQTGQYVSAWERGLALPSPKSLRRLSKTLQMSDTQEVMVRKWYQELIGVQIDRAFVVDASGIKLTTDPTRTKLYIHRLKGEKKQRAVRASRTMKKVAKKKAEGNHGR